MSLSRKHFQALADITRDARSAATQPPFNNATDALDAVQQSLADFCSQHNPNFDRARFLAACEPSTSKE